MNANLEQLVRDAERHAKSKDEWRKSALISLAVGNGGGLAALAAWSARFDDFGEAVRLFLPSMWIYAAGLLFAGALPFAAWWVTDILSDNRAGQVDEEMAKQLVPKDSSQFMKQQWLIARGEYRRGKARHITLALMLLRVLVVGSALLFVTATSLALWRVSSDAAFQLPSDVVESPKGAAGAPSPHRR